MSLAYVPCIEQDETVYSWCATIHGLSANLTSEATSRQLFGISHASRQHVLPSRASELLRRFSDGDQSLENLLRRHTVAGLFFPFAARSHERQEAIRELMASKQVGASGNQVSAAQTLWRTLLCHTRSMPLDYPLKWCKFCVRCDQDRLGRSYWHVQHQWPTSMVCHRHAVKLNTYVGSGKKWLLPSALSGGSETPQEDRSFMVADAIINALASQISTMESIDTRALRVAALVRMQRLGIIHSTHSVRHDRIEHWFRAGAIGAWCQNASCGMSCLASGEWLPKLLWRQKQDHPIRWIVAWAALEWSTPEEAASAFLICQKGVSEGANGQLLLFAADTTLNAQSTPEHVRRAFDVAASYEEAMTLLSASRGDIVRWLEADPELRRCWRSRLLTERVDKAALTLIVYRSKFPGISREALVDLAPKDVTLLRKHRRELLHQIMASIPATRVRQLGLF
ncbi:TniQ family protein [Variovorax sp. HJSM1_2]|uniref:TniQ family protein n=1 Tax=Variovorax sp. HJSM1_2 TaxID=3366263 RepID=UPI003BCD9624